MNLWCYLFGHKALTNAGWCHGIGYANVGADAIDGIGRRHLYINADCPRCGEIYSICNVHVPKEQP